MNYKLSPSDLTFLYDSCRHCFVLKVKHGIAQPSIPLPAIFTKIAALQKEYYSGKRTEEFCPTLPPGVVTYGEQWVRSHSLELSGCSSNCYINGRFDIVAKLDDGSFAVLDFKTGTPSEEKSRMYARQLQAYALALENPAQGALRLSPVSRLGLLYFTPDKCEQPTTVRQVLEGELQWVEVGRNDEGFLSFLQEVVRLLDGPLPEPERDTCHWCSYRARTGSLPGHDRAVGATAMSKGSLPTCPLCKGPMQLKKGKYGEFWSCLNYPKCKGTRDASPPAQPSQQALKW